MTVGINNVLVVASAIQPFPTSMAITEAFVTKRSTFDGELLKCGLRIDDMAGRDRRTINETSVDSAMIAFTSARIKENASDDH